MNACKKLTFIKIYKKPIFPQTCQTFQKCFIRTNSVWLSDHCHCVESHHADLTLVSTVAHQVTSSSAVSALSAAGVVEAPAGRCSLSTPAGRVTRRPRALLRSDPSAPYPSEREDR